MSRIRSRDTKLELAVEAAFRALPRPDRCAASVRGKPDFAWVAQRVAVFAHGCFWHGHKCRAWRHKSQFWRDKILRNQQRDAEVEAELREAGWAVFIVWECEATPERLASLARQVAWRLSHEA